MSSKAPVVLVTGSSEGGIGYALCQAFAERGCKVYGTARRPEAIESLKKYGVVPLVLNVDDPESCKNAVETIVKDEGRIDVLVNNAGAGATGALLDFSVDTANDVIKTNVLAPLRLAQLVAPLQHAEFKKSGRRGLIANVGSIVGDIPTPWAGVYAISKAAMHALTNVLRMECEGLGVDVMLIAPGAVTSGFGSRQEASYLSSSDSLYKHVDHHIRRRAQMGQMGATPNAVFAAGLVGACLRPPRAWWNPLALIFGSGPPAFYSAGGRWFQFWFLNLLPTLTKFRIIAKSTGASEVKNFAA